MGQRQATPRLRVLVSDDKGRRLPEAHLARWLARIAPARARGVLSLVLARDSKVHALNRLYRHQDRPTDVLTFSADVSPALQARRAGRAAPTRYLGDIVIARGVARRQARAAGHSRETELRVLALHGLLHLLGYDHHGSDKGAMKRVEERLRARGGLREGLIERASSGGRR
jgi:probable rRNA maturation factor